MSATARGTGRLIACLLLTAVLIVDSFRDLAPQRDSEAISIMETPTTRTLKLCRQRLWIADKTEQFVHVPQGRSFRRDLFGFIDIVALTPHGCLAIQATSGSNGSSRVKKILTERSVEAQAWLRSGGLIEVWAWRKLPKPVERRWWQPRVYTVTADDFAARDSEF